ncbi:excinuclease ABC subunit UvrC [bacterium]|nr:excinuclease ABC subunit UvrC [bacterium]
MQISLDTKLGALPKQPGVYQFKDSSGLIIYIGKARVLRNRVRSYFQKTNDGRYQYELLVSRIADVEVITTDTELEALILESTLIQKHKPRFNVDLKDDKSFPYLRVTNEEFPKVFLTRKPVMDGSKYFGPFSDLRYLKGLLHVLRGMLKIRSCNLPLTEAGISAGKFKDCLEYQIRRCNAPCVGRESREEYDKHVKDFIDVIKGRDADIISRLREEMREHAEHQRFEQAAQLRDWLSAVAGLTQKQKVISADPINRDICGLAIEDADGFLVFMQIRAGRMMGRVHYRLRHLKDRALPEILESALQQYYSSAVTIPDELVLPFAPDNLDLLTRWLKNIVGSKVEIIIPARGEKVQMADLAHRNAELLLGEYKIAKQQKSRIPAAVKEIQSRLGLPKLPRTIAGFDISTLQGIDKVASMVVFKNGRPVRSEYRKFKIKTVEGQDDFASMHEVIYRRFSRLQREGALFPDLVLIDGGKGQLAAGVSALKKLDIHDQPILGLAKRIEEIYLPGEDTPHNLPRTSSGLKLLQQLRDEAHRFAITYHRSLRKKSTMQSQLEDIPGIGPARRKALLAHFKSMQRLTSASLQELEEVPGLSSKTAGQVRDYFQSKTSTGS